MLPGLTAHTFDRSPLRQLITGSRSASAIGCAMSSLVSDASVLVHRHRNLTAEEANTSQRLPQSDNIFSISTGSSTHFTHCTFVPC